MKVLNYPRVTIVTLSQKNLRDLTAQVESGRETVALVRDIPEDGRRLYVVVEPDEVHYADRAAGPGSGLVS